MKKSDQKTITRQPDSSSTPSQPRANFKRSSKTKRSAWTPQEEKDRKRSRAIVSRLSELGYKKGDNGNFPCFCGERPDDYSVWWLSNNNSREDHLFCLRCTKRIPEFKIKDMLKEYFERITAQKVHEYSKEEVNISELLSRN
jgi:hypothetical protein